MYPPPQLDISLDQLQEYAARSVLARVTVTGVQKKLSLSIEKPGKDSRFTIVGLWWRFILKPPVEDYPFLPQNEYTIMQMASAFGIHVVPHSLIRLASGELAYISRRIDRADQKEKIAMEDFCQISERLTEDKYKGSAEKVGKLLAKHSAYPGLDIVNFFERIVFNFICANADMHLKNYSLIETPEGLRLSPAYDLVSTILAIPEGREESALTINGKKSRLTINDFNALATCLGIAEKTIQKTYAHFAESKAVLLGLITGGFLPEDMKATLRAIVIQRLSRLAR